jgi:hypothetical protein
MGSGLALVFDGTRLLGSSKFLVCENISARRDISKHAAKRFGGLEVYEQLDLRCLLDWQIGGFSSSVARWGHRIRYFCCRA